jgi:hypothetical protein
MIRKGQLDCPAESTASAAAQFYGLAFCVGAGAILTLVPTID